MRSLTILSKISTQPLRPFYILCIAFIVSDISLFISLLCSHWKITSFRKITLSVLQLYPLHLEHCPQYSRNEHMNKYLVAFPVQQIPWEVPVDAASFLSILLTPA